MNKFPSNCWIVRSGRNIQLEAPDNAVVNRFQAATVLPPEARLEMLGCTQALQLPCMPLALAPFLYHSPKTRIPILWHSASHSSILTDVREARCEGWVRTCVL